jgi:hypothetical protein
MKKFNVFLSLLLLSFSFVSKASAGTSYDCRPTQASLSPSLLVHLKFDKEFKSVGIPYELTAKKSALMVHYKGQLCGGSILTSAIQTDGTVNLECEDKSFGEFGKFGYIVSLEQFAAVLTFPNGLDMGRAAFSNQRLRVFKGLTVPLNCVDQADSSSLK